MALWVLAAVLGILASFEDLRSRTIPNWLTLAGFLAGLLFAACHGWHSLGIAFAGGLLGFALLLPLHLCGAMGGGDVKLMAAFGTLLGPYGIFAAAIFGAIAGGVWAIAARCCGARTIPYAPAIAAGVWFTLLGGSL